MSKLFLILNSISSRISGNWNRISGRIPDIKKGRISGTTLIRTYILFQEVYYWVSQILQKVILTSLHVVLRSTMYMKVMYLEFSTRKSSLKCNDYDYNLELHCCCNEHSYWEAYEKLLRCSHTFHCPLAIKFQSLNFFV